MARRRAGRGWLAILASFVVALVLTAIPLPGWAAPWQPLWVTLVLVYWCMGAPQHVGVGAGWLVGIVLDVLEGGLLGQNALAMAAVAFLTTTFHLRLRMFPLWQQGVTVLVLMLVNLGLIAWVKGITDTFTGGWWFWLPALTSGLIWPWLFIIMRDVRRHAGVT